MSGFAPPSSAPDASHTRNSPLIVALVAAAYLDVTIITTALPQMVCTFNVLPADLGIGVSSYLLTVAAFIPLSG
jgi:hypothetical protein